MALDLKTEQDELTADELKVMELFDKVLRHELSPFQAFTILSEMINSPSE